MTLIIDIETGPLPDEILQERFVFDESKIPGFKLLSQEFNESEVKIGNLKDPAKIKEKIEKARDDFALKKRTAEISIEEGRVDAWEVFVSKAALSPLTGQVLAVGLHHDSWDKPTNVFCADDINFDEKALVSYTLEALDVALSGRDKVIGHNLLEFDIPFLIRRGLFYGIMPPLSIINQIDSYRPSHILDTMRLWKFGARSEMNTSLDNLAAYFGTTRKNGSGALFYKKFFGTEVEKVEALNYLENDIQMTLEIAQRLGIA